MLENITIKNFQSHKHTVLDLHKGINVITGTSDVGKSSIRRAFEWLQLNRPRGNAFIRNQATGETKVSILLDGTNVCRTKAKGINSYALGKSTFKVVGSDVPTEITKFLNLDEVSVQGQHDKYFLLQDTAGEVAKKLNKIAGFDIIDYLMKSVKSAITTNITDLKYTDAAIVKLDEEIKQYEHLDTVEKQLAIVAKTVKTYTENDTTIEHLHSILNEIENIKETITDLDGWLSIEDLIIPLLETASELDTQQETSTNIQGIVDTITEHTKLIKRLSAKAHYESEVGAIDNLISERNTQLQASQKLFMALAEINKNTKWYTELENNLVVYEAQLDQLLKEHKMCPMCGTKLTTKTASHIKELI